MAHNQVTTSTGASEFGGATEAIYFVLQSNSSEVGDSVTGEHSSLSSLSSFRLFFSTHRERIAQLFRRELSSEVEVDIESPKADWTRDVVNERRGRR